MNHFCDTLNQRFDEQGEQISNQQSFLIIKALFGIETSPGRVRPLFAMFR